VRRGAVLALALLALGGCGRAKRAPVVAAIEVPVATTRDRQDLVDALRQAARGDPALHADDATAQWMAMQARDRATPPGKRATLYAGVWRGARDDEPVAIAVDYLHTGRVWVSFMDSSDRPGSLRLRQGALRALRARFPQAHDLPVLPSGGLPRDEDLRMTTGGYRIAAARAPAYDLSPGSPLLAR
jgi:hypothetical protein